MKLFYYQGNNFGDKLNPIIWNTLAEGLLDDDDSKILVGIGTLINSNVPVSPEKFIFGSGAGYMNSAKVDDKWHFYCVRGPLTASLLNLDSRLAITDPALLLREIYTDPVASTGEVCFMPHHVSADYADWRAICAKAGITYLDPADETDWVIEKIRGARLVIAEAMHAAIVADAFRVPWVPLQIYDHILGFKWEDWCQSMQLPYKPVTVPSVWDADRLLSNSEKAKAWIKRGLKGAGIWSDNWTPALPAPNLRKIEDQVLMTLQSLSQGSDAYLSNEAVQQRALDRLLQTLELMKRHHLDAKVSAA